MTGSHETGIKGKISTPNISAAGRNASTFYHRPIGITPALLTSPPVSVSSVIILTISNTTVIEGEAAFAISGDDLAAIEPHVCFDGRTAVAQIGQVQHDKDEDQEFHIVKIIELIQLMLHFIIRLHRCLML